MANGVLAFADLDSRMRWGRAAGRGYWLTAPTGSVMLIEALWLM
jgi:hypothetical protein